MKVKYCKVMVEMSPMTKISKIVPEWEVPVLEEKLGSVTVVEEIEHEFEEAPDAAAEANRLMRHGVEDETKQSFFEITYGRGKAGARELEKAIKSACKAAKKTTKKATAKKQEPATDADESDPME